jgi:hypothetical protein
MISNIRMNLRITNKIENNLIIDILLKIIKKWKIWMSRFSRRSWMRMTLMM